MTRPTGRPQSRAFELRHGAWSPWAIKKGRNDVRRARHMHRCDNFLSSATGGMCSHKIRKGDLFFAILVYANRHSTTARICRHCAHIVEGDAARLICEGARREMALEQRQAGQAVAEASAEQAAGPV